MRKLVLAGLAVAAMALPGASRAQVNVGLRLNYAIPMGNTVKGEKMTDGISGQIPIQLDVGYRVIPELTLGVYGSYGFGMIASNIKDSTDSISTLNLGVQALYDFPAFQQIKPWAGLGVGYEWMTISPKVGDSAKADGWEFARLQVGADYAVAKNFNTGLFLSYSFAQFGTVSSGGVSVSVPSDQKAMHEWFQIGIRGSYDL